MSKISWRDVRIEKLHQDHDISNFQCFEKELVKFLQEDALGNQNKKISVTYLLFLEESNHLVGYITLLNDRIDLTGNLKYYFNQKGILYTSLPALKIGRLAVDDNFLRRGIGTIMAYFAFEKAETISLKTAGCRFVTLEAKRNKDNTKDSINFYNKLNFKILKETKKATAMYLDLLDQW